MLTPPPHTQCHTQAHCLPACMCVGADVLAHAKPASAANVQNCFEHAIHIQLQDGRLITLLCGNAQHGMRIVNITHAAWPEIRRSLPLHSTLEISSFGLKSQQIHLHWKDSVTWHTPELEQFSTPQASLHLRQNLPLAHEWIQKQFAEKALSQNSVWQAAYTQFLELIPCIATATKNNETTLTTRVRKLIGLGLGLTPSGDDMLAGFLIGLLAGHSQTHFMLLCTAIQEHQHLTTTASQDMLNQASQGWITEKIENVLQALTQAPNTEKLHQPLMSQCTIGHSSGFDTLIGLLAGLCTASAFTPHKPFLPHFV